MRRLAPVLELIGTMTRSRLRLWRAENDTARLACGDDPGWSPSLPPVEGPHETPGGPSWFTPAPEHDGLWLEIHGDAQRPHGTPRASLAAPLIQLLLSSEQEAERLYRNELFIADLAGQMERAGEA